jgi:AcrR family transcriptional regulator
MDAILTPVQDRSHDTQLRLVVASAKRLVADGLSTYSTTAVAKEAKASQGALFKHFPNKSLLLAKTVEHLLDFVFRRFDGAVMDHIEEFERGTLDARVSVAVGALWSIFRSDELRAIFEVFVAARTDPMLDGLLAPILTSHRARIHRTATRIFDEVADHPDGLAAIDAILFAMQGAAIGLFGSALRDDATNIAFFERLAHRELKQLEQST